MAENNATTAPAPRRPHRWLKVLGWIFGTLIVLLVVVYFVGTSSAFFKGVILPKASAALNATITVSDASISPFHQVVLHNLKVQTTGAEPLVTAPEVTLRYSLMDIIGGNIHVDEMTLASPTIMIVENPDKSGNLDPILRKINEKPAQPSPASSKPSKPTRIDIVKVQIKDATIQQIKIYDGSHRDVTELSHVNVSVDNLKNGQIGKLALAAGISLQKNPPAPGTNATLQASLEGNFSLGLSPALKPSTVQGDAKLAVTRAEGAFAEAAGLNTTLHCDVTPTEIKQVALNIAKGETRLGQLRVAGPFDMEKSEGRLNIELLNVDKNVLNLAGASSGIDFGPTRVNSTNEVQIGNAGKSVAIAGQFNLEQLQLTRTNQSTPPLDLHANYDVALDSAASNATLRSFTLTGVQDNAQVVQGGLTSPMVISWGSAASSVGNSSLNVALTHLKLANWKAFLGDVAPAGDVSFKLQLTSQQGGKQLGFDVTSEISDLTAGSGSNQISQANVSLALHGQATDLKRFSFPQYSLTLSRQNQPLLTAAGSGTYDQEAATADVQLNAQVQLARLLQALPRPDLQITSGSAEAKLHITQAPIENRPAGSQNTSPPTTQHVTGNFVLADFSGSAGSNTFRGFGTTADMEVTMTPAVVQIGKVSGKISEGNTPGGAFSLSGTYALTNKSAQLSAELANFNESGLRPFLEPMLSGKQLKSVALYGNTSLKYEPEGASTVKASLQVTNLVVHDPKGQFPSTPLGAGFQLDASLNKQVAEIRQCQLALSPTQRATNQVQLTGRIDRSDTNAMTGNVKIAANSLDLTSYYDLFEGPQKSSAKRPATTTTPGSSTPAAPPSSAPGQPEQEPEPTQLPVRNFTAEATIGRLWLHEVDITNFQMMAKIDGGHVVINPFKLALNGAPVDAGVDVDLGVRGYKYDVSFAANTVPLAPLVNTFEPERKGELGGTFTGNAKIAGAGITGPSLKKNLNGQFYFGSTNLNLSVVNIRSPMLKALINVIAIIPELTRNPEGAVGSLLGSLVSPKGAGKSGGLSGELERSPIDKIIGNGNIGAGKVDLQQAIVQSPAFEAMANGTIMLADILTNSAIQIPVTISLSRSLAERVNLLPANVPTNNPYVPLPKFYTMKGTVGDPKQDIDYRALAGTVFHGISGIIPGANAGGRTGNIVQGLNGLLGGGTAPTSTNAPGTNQAGNPLSGVLQGLGGAIGGARAPATTNAPPATNQNPVNNLLKGFLK